MDHRPRFRVRPHRTKHIRIAIKRADSAAEDLPIVDSVPGSRAAISLVRLAERLERGRRSVIVADVHEYNFRIVSELDGDSDLSLL